MPNIALRHENLVTLAGELVKEAAIRTTQSGKRVAHFTIRTVRKNSAEFHRCAAWDTAAAKLENVEPGEFIQLQGRLQTRSWDDKESGQKRYTTEVNCWQIIVPAREEVTISTTGAQITHAEIPF